MVSLYWFIILVVLGLSALALLVYHHSLPTATLIKTHLFSLDYCVYTIEISIKWFCEIPSPHYGLDLKCSPEIFMLKLGSTAHLCSELGLWEYDWV